MTESTGAMGSKRRRNMQDIVPTVKTPTNGQMPDEEMIQRSVASFVAVSRERDALSAKVDMLEIDLQGKDATIAALKDMLKVFEDQMKLREQQTETRIATYQNERDLAVAELARSETQFEDLFKSMVGVLQAFRAQGGELVKKATSQT